MLSVPSGSLLLAWPPEKRAGSSELVTQHPSTLLTRISRKLLRSSVGCLQDLQYLQSVHDMAMGTLMQTIMLML